MRNDLMTGNTLPFSRSNVNIEQNGASQADTWPSTGTWVRVEA
jgi:hypothetical protein